EGQTGLIGLNRIERCSSMADPRTYHDRYTTRGPSQRVANYTRRLGEFLDETFTPIEDELALPTPALRGSDEVLLVLDEVGTANTSDSDPFFETRRVPLLDPIRDALGVKTTVTNVPVAIDYTDGFTEAYYTRPK